MLIVRSGPILNIIIILISCVIVIKCAPTGWKKDDDDFDTENKRVEPQLEERLDIIYDNTVFKTVKPGILQLLKNASKVILECKSTKGSSTFVNWAYHGIKEDAVKLAHHQNSIWLTKFPEEGPPVARMECTERDNGFVSNSTLIYKGDGQPPYLYKSGDTLSITVFNNTIAQLPCLLNYPLDGELAHLQLQLFKDKELIKNATYTPEYGFSLNLTSLEQPFGSYECRVTSLAKSTDYNEDFIKMELTNDEIIRAEIQVAHRNNLKFFYKGDPSERSFFCKIPKSTFENKFEWFYRLSSGKYIPVDPVTAPETKNEDPLLYDNWIMLKFPNATDITDVVCLAYTKYNEISYNNTYAVVTTEPIKPKIVHRSPSSEPIIYKPGMKLTCSSDGDPVTINWLKNGDPVDAATSSSINNGITTSNITLQPRADDVDSNYTCVADNFLGNSTSTYRVQLKTSGTISLVTLGICMIVSVIVMLIILVFFKVRVIPRQFSKAKIKQFFDGFLSRENAHTSESQEPYESHPYDATKEINKSALNILRELNSGQFGKVQFGYYRNIKTGSEQPVAIKSIKDNPTASLQDVEFAFNNFLKEIKHMQMLGNHPNVVRYIGAVTSDLSRYSAYLVIEYCSEGDLCTYLRTLRDGGGSFQDDIQGLHNNDMMLSGSNSNNMVGYVSAYFSSGSGELLAPYEPLHVSGGVVLKTSHLIKWAEDIASGMEYIASKKLVHRDIAARNILLACEDFECSSPDPGMLRAKISDFGLSKNLHEYPKDYYSIVNRDRKLMLPIRWMAVETMQTLKFTTQSDVWAYGVTLWELFTLGVSPYQGLFDDGDNLIHALFNFLKQGNTLPEPEFAPQEIWEIMSSCWTDNPNDRPTFEMLKELLHSINENIREQQASQQDESPAEWNELVQSDDTRSVQSESQGEEELETEDTFV